SVSASDVLAPQLLLLLVFLTLRRPPRPPPFPYTTLFRSRGGRRRGGRRPLPFPALHGGHRTARGSEAALPPPHLHHGAGKGRGRDRKSTRLNSSHGSISYAVFCLKKKKHAE